MAQDGSLPSHVPNWEYYGCGPTSPQTRQQAVEALNGAIEDLQLTCGVIPWADPLHLRRLHLAVMTVDEALMCVKFAIDRLQSLDARLMMQSFPEPQQVVQSTPTRRAPPTVDDLLI